MMILPPQMQIPEYGEVAETNMQIVQAINQSILVLPMDRTEAKVDFICHSQFLENIF